ncbi:MAG: histidine triad nucleotide-binding protein [Chloroflexi bacterium]|nr:histidine triad nucleotide-binding protein [Chloroflexota bacterium]|tara:strand:- start:999 stop:1346 length:348 start_codon:yes stop_codon:yes gene_type:complete
MSKSLFSKIIDREIPADIVYEDNEIISFKDINPAAPIHILIVPKKVIPTLNDLDDKDDYKLIGKMFKVAQKLAKDNNLSVSGFRTVFNCNEDGGQTVYHLHLHLLGGRQFQWPPG